MGIREEYLVFDLEATDMVLGYTWLEKLGETRINWGVTCDEVPNWIALGDLQGTLTCSILRYR